MKQKVLSPKTFRAESLQQLKPTRKDISVIFATGASQLQTLRTLTSMVDIPWSQIRGFHLDEYIGLDATHPATFRHYLRENITARVPLRKFFEIDGTSPDPELVCCEYAQRLHASDPQICFLGFGENGHLTFNDPGEADFNDPKDVKVVNLDKTCRGQQAAEGEMVGLQVAPIFLKPDIRLF